MADALDLAVAVVRCFQDRLHILADLAGIAYDDVVILPFFLDLEAYNRIYGHEQLSLGSYAWAPLAKASPGSRVINS